MDAYPLLQTYQEMNLGVDYDEIIKVGSASLCLSHHDKGILGNYALVNAQIPQEELKKIEAVFSKHDRMSTIYFEERVGLLNLIDSLKEQGYKQTITDSWLFYEDEVKNQAKFDQIKIVKTDADFEAWLQTLDKCFVNDDPQNPYGPITHYVESSRKRWPDKKNNPDLEYYVVYEDGKPVATSMLNNRNGLGYIAAVGSLPSARGKGYGKLASLFAVYRSQQRKNFFTCLSTEEGHFPYKFYTRIGFNDRLRAVSFTKGEGEIIY